MSPPGFLRIARSREVEAEGRGKPQDGWLFGGRSENLRRFPVFLGELFLDGHPAGGLTHIFGIFTPT